MKLVWTDGYFLEKPFGSKVVGLKRNGKRPDHIELDWLDKNRFEEMKDDNLKLRYLRNLFFALSYKEEQN